MPRPTILTDPDLCAQAIILVRQGRRRDYIARALGVSRGAANSFLERFDLYGEDGVMPDTHSFKSYSQQTKLDAVQAYLSGDTATDVARRFGVTTASQIYTWVKAYRDHGPDDLAWRRRGRPKADTVPADEMTEVQKLAAEVEMLKAENAYLKALAALEAAEQDASQDADTDTDPPPRT